MGPQQMQQQGGYMNTMQHAPQQQWQVFLFLLIQEQLETVNPNVSTFNPEPSTPESGTQPIHLGLEAQLCTSVKLFRGGLVCKAHRRVYHSTPGWRVIKKKR